MKVWDHNTCNDENESLRQQLAAAIAACKLKDEALQNCEGVLDELRDYPITHDAIIEALAIQPDDSALKAWVVSKDDKEAIQNELKPKTETKPMRRVK